MKKFLFSLLILLCLANLAQAAEQRAYALTETVKLYAKASEGSSYTEVSLPEDGVNVPSATRDAKDNLWYKVTVDGETGWLAQEGIRLKMGGKSKSADNLFRKCVAARQKIIKNPGTKWEEGDAIENSGSAAGSGKVITFVNNANGALFQVVKHGSKLEDVYFKATSSSMCKLFLGFDAIGMNRNEIRSKVGTPTVRETPDGEPNVSITSYEMADKNFTLAFHFTDGLIDYFEIYKGRAGEAAKGWTPDVLYERDQI
nr:hypothetical protein [Synergistaceae bacterium]